jgi:NitT/TauT family transport system substrate-binding protein
VLGVVALSAAACGTGSATSPDGRTILRLGYFPNLTHGSAILGVEQGIYAEHLGEDVALRTSRFNAGPEAVEALFAGAVDATFIGPSPAINAHVQSHGEAIRIVAGATAGGAFLIVRPGIDEPDDLRGATLSSPQLGNTQDVALRAWLADQGLKTDTLGGGDVRVQPQPNAQILETFRAGEIDGAWVPEPWASRMVQDGGGQILVDEADLWPAGRYVTTHLVVRAEYLRAHPGVVRRLIEGHVAATDRANEQPDEAKRAVNAALEMLSGKALASTVLDAAWANLAFTVDPIASSLRRAAADAHALGMVRSADLDGIYDLTLLNEVLRAQGRDEVADA